jgi:triphosphoribosyl-dephospho-CoA synthetase
VRQQYRVKGALDLAVEGYGQLFEQWLPFYRQHVADDYPQQRLLLYIISTLDDNNLYHRGGEQLAHEAQQRCAQVLQDFSMENILVLNDWMKARNLSPGGSADMLALTLFAAHLLYNI